MPCINDLLREICENLAVLPYPGAIEDGCSAIMMHISDKNWDVQNFLVAVSSSWEYVLVVSISFLHLLACLVH